MTEKEAPDILAAACSAVGLDELDDLMKTIDQNTESSVARTSSNTVVQDTPSVARKLPAELRDAQPQFQSPHLVHNEVHVRPQYSPQHLAWLQRSYQGWEVRPHYYNTNPRYVTAVPSGHYQPKLSHNDTNRNSEPYRYPAPSTVHHPEQPRYPVHVTRSVPHPPYPDQASHYQTRPRHPVVCESYRPHENYHPPNMPPSQPHLVPHHANESAYRGGPHPQYRIHNPTKPVIQDPRQLPRSQISIPNRTAQIHHYTGPPPEYTVSTPQNPNSHINTEVEMPPPPQRHHLPTNAQNATYPSPSRKRPPTHSHLESPSNAQVNSQTSQAYIHHHHNQPQRMPQMTVRYPVPQNYSVRGSHPPYGNHIPSHIVPTSVANPSHMPNSPLHAAASYSREQAMHQRLEHYLPPSESVTSGRVVTLEERKHSTEQRVANTVIRANSMLPRKEIVQPPVPMYTLDPKYHPQHDSHFKNGIVGKYIRAPIYNNLPQPNDITRLLNPNYKEHSALHLSSGADNMTKSVKLAQPVRYDETGYNLNDKSQSKPIRRTTITESGHTVADSSPIARKVNALEQTPNYSQSRSDRVSGLPPSPKEVYHKNYYHTDTAQPYPPSYAPQSHLPPGITNHENYSPQVHQISPVVQIDYRKNENQSNKVVAPPPSAPSLPHKPAVPQDTFVHKRSQIQQSSGPQYIQNNPKLHAGVHQQWPSYQRAESYRIPHPNDKIPSQRRVDLPARNQFPDDISNLHLNRTKNVLNMTNESDKLPSNTARFPDNTHLSQMSNDLHAKNNYLSLPSSNKRSCTDSDSISGNFTIRACNPFEENFESKSTPHPGNIPKKRKLNPDLSTPSPKLLSCQSDPNGSDSPSLSTPPTIWPSNNNAETCVMSSIPSTSSNHNDTRQEKSSLPERPKIIEFCKARDSCKKERNMSPKARIFERMKDQGIFESQIDSSHRKMSSENISPNLMSTEICATPKETERSASFDTDHSSPFSEKFRSTGE